MYFCRLGGHHLPGGSSSLACLLLKSSKSWAVRSSGQSNNTRNFLNMKERSWAGNLVSCLD